MAGQNGSSEELVEDESGEEDAEEASSASFASEDDEEDFVGDDSDNFETSQKPKKRPKMSGQISAPKNASKSAPKGKVTPAKPAAASAEATPKPSLKPPATSVAAKKSLPTPTLAKGKGRATLSEALPSPGGGKCATPGEASAKESPASSTVKSTLSGAVSRTPKNAEGTQKEGKGSSVAAAGGAKTPKGAVSDYMLRSNRPYSCINVFDNMHKKIPKAMMQKLLDELTRDGMLKVQDYNKAKIYYANQDVLPDGAGDVSDEKLRQLEQQGKDLTSKLEVASKEAGRAQARAQALAAQPTDAELDEKLASTSREIEQMEARNGAIKGQGRSAVAGGMKASKAEFNKFRALWVNRKRNAMDVVDMVADGMEKKPKVVMEMLGLEVDEEPIPAKM